jgi:hypothetical protein
MQGAPGLSGASDDEGILVGQPADVCALSVLYAPKAVAIKPNILITDHRRRDAPKRKARGEIIDFNKGVGINTVMLGLNYRFGSSQR